jgi:hypothetical protein
LKVNYVFLVPWVVLSLPPGALFHKELYLMASLVIIGLAGMLLRIRTSMFVASAGLIVLVVWGKVASDLFSLPSEDSAALLLQFMMIIFLMEASSTALTVQTSWMKLEGKDDDLSNAARLRLIGWASAQLRDLGKLTAGGFALAMGLLLIGGFINVSFNQLALNGILALAAVVAILILLTYGREPNETPRKN